jgi:hypothetical protein
MVLRTLRAFAWMRWRVLLNSLERTGSRDRLERLSLAVEQIGPLIALALLAPASIGLAWLGGYAGYWLAAGPPVMTFEALRIVLLAACGFSVVGPLLMPSMEPTTIVRLLLLPIPRRTLYAAQSAGALSEPWVLISVPVVLSIPVGLAVGGKWLAAVIALVAGLLLIFCLVGLSTFTTLLLHLVVRDRRRGELLALLFIVVIPAISLMPALMMQSHDRPEDAEHRRRSTTPMPAWVTRTADVAYAVVPSELFTRATRSSAQREPDAAVLPLVVLVTSGGLLHALGMMTFARLLDSPSAGARRLPASQAGPGHVRLPFLSRASAAVAQVQLRLAMRTPRGRSILLSPFVVFVVVAIVMHRQGEMTLGVISLGNGLNLATFGGALCFFAILPFAMNQFAIDRSGLTLALLSPLGTRELLAGKAVGIGLIAGGPAIVCVLVAFILFPGGAPALWMSLPPALVATYLLFAPGAATLSALFPRTVDLNSIGRGSNAHGFANLLGLLVFVAAGLPSILIVIVTTSLVQIPALTPIVMLAWCGIALILSRLLFGGVAVLFDKRRENLGLVAS